MLGQISDYNQLTLWRWNYYFFLISAYLYIKCE